ncbi:MAG TPA: DUF3471 domain-containing protein, partial [Alphaproteobacteria bacterium]|nr:DUF3471 domain-containing protein [Alphaproteobacteria bacterium]
KSGVGVVVLCNASTNAGGVDIGHHLLDSDTHLTDPSEFNPPKEHKETAVEGKILDSYVGVYQLTPAFALTVKREGDHLLMQATGQSQFPIFAESEHDFFAKIADIQFTFQTDAQGHATGIVLHQLGRDVPGKRVEAEPAK